MNRRRNLKPPVPHSLSERERAAFDLWDALNTPLRVQGWTLLIRVAGFEPTRFVVVELRRGTSKNVRALREIAIWRVTDGLWLRAGTEPIECTGAGHARELIAEAVAKGPREILRPRKRKGKRAVDTKRLRPRGAKLDYLTHDLHDRENQS